MKVFKVDAESWQQQDCRTTRPTVAMHSGIHDLTAVNIKNKSFDERVAVESKFIQNEAAHQKEHDIANNKYSANIENQTLIGADKLENIDPVLGESIENGQANTFSAMGAGADQSDDDYMYEMSIPGCNKKLYIYTKQQHNEMKGGGIRMNSSDLEGGLIVPEDTNTTDIASSSNDIQSSGAGVSFADDTNASGVSFADDTNGQGIAFNNKELDAAINNLENSKGGAVPAILGEIALNLIPQIPGIISAIKSKRDDTKVGKGLSNAMANNKLVSQLYSALPNNRPANFYNDMIKEFNGLKRSGSGLQVRDKEYYASGKITEGLKKFFNWVKKGYNDNKELFAPIRDALLSATTSSITSGVNKAANKLTDTVRNKTQNEHLNNIAEAVSTVGKNIGKEVNKQIEASVLA